MLAVAASISEATVLRTMFFSVFTVVEVMIYSSLNVNVMFFTPASVCTVYGINSGRDGPISTWGKSPNRLAKMAKKCEPVQV
jgi:hypothetical protein